MRVRTILIVGAGAAIGAAVTYVRAVRPWWRSWGVAPGDEALTLAGDDLVAGANVVETRGIEIGAPPDAVWPWLVQMGYNRAGWYSYDVVDMKGASVDRLVPELQALEVGDLVPNSPDTAFVVRSLEPGRALVLYADEKLVEEQVAAAQARKAAGETSEATPANLRVAERAMPSMPGFAASWAFVLQPLDGGTRTRLLERFRVRMPAPDGRVAGAMAGVFGFGVFAMTRKQMLGIRDRTEADFIADGLSAEFARRTGTGESAIQAVPEDAAPEEANEVAVAEGAEEVAVAEGAEEVAVAEAGDIHGSSEAGEIRGSIEAGEIRGSSEAEAGAEGR